MGWGAAVEVGTVFPSFLTAGPGAICEEKTERSEAVFVEGMDSDGTHGQTSHLRTKHTTTARGKGSVTANSTGAGTSEETAMIDRLEDGQKNEDFDSWSAEAHWYT